jgi:hypothetical protein
MIGRNVIGVWVAVKGNVSIAVALVKHLMISKKISKF